MEEFYCHWEGIECISMFCKEFLDKQFIYLKKTKQKLAHNKNRYWKRKRNWDKMGDMEDLTKEILIKLEE